jgi:hypothetical protein
VRLSPDARAALSNRPTTAFRALVGHGLAPTAPAFQEKTPPVRGFYFKRMMGLEPTTFCMANRPGRVGLAEALHG